MKRALFLSVSLLILVCVLPQAPRNRITGAVSGRVTVPLAGDRHPLARPERDAGQVPGDRVLSHLKMVLRRDPAQQAAFDAFTAAQQYPQSPLYHQWLTPEEVGARFGVSQPNV